MEVISLGNCVATAGKGMGIAWQGGGTQVSSFVERFGC